MCDKTKNLKALSDLLTYHPATNQILYTSCLMINIHDLYQVMRLRC